MIEITRILCPVDFSPFSERALTFAMHIAHWFDARLHVLHVCPPAPASLKASLAESSRALTGRHLVALVDQHRLRDVHIETEIVEADNAAECILSCADRIDADLVITGSHGRSGVSRALLGSVVETLLHRAGRPILTVPSHVDPSRLARPSFDRILCAVDFASASLAALAHACALAEERGGRLTLVHVIGMPPEMSAHPLPADFDITCARVDAEAQAHARLMQLIPGDARDYCTVDTEVLEGEASRRILQAAVDHEADLIVLGVHGRIAFDLAFFGSNSKDIIRHAHCPVLVVPASRRSLMRAVC